MNECTLFYSHVARKRQSLNVGVLFHTPLYQHTSYQSCYFVGDYFLGGFFFYLLADNLDNPLVSTGLEQLSLSVLPKDTYGHNGKQRPVLNPLPLGLRQARQPTVLRRRTFMHVNYNVTLF